MWRPVCIAGGIGYWPAPGNGRAAIGVTLQKYQRSFCDSHTNVSAEHAARAIWLSILVPVYNVAPYLRACINSILSQIDGDDIEIILLDDASTDGSREMCEQMRSEHGRHVRLVVHAENRGISAVRNSLLDTARGEYIWFVDSDDEMLAGAIAGLRRIINDHAPDLVMCDYRKENKSYSSFIGKSSVLQTDREALIKGVFASRRMHFWSIISRRALWAKDLRFPDLDCFEDVAVKPRLLLRACSFYHVPEEWISYRVRPGSLVGIVSRSRGKFDDKKNDDLAIALVGYADALKKDLPAIKRDTLYHTAHFCAKEFTKIAFRLLSTRLGKDDWASISRRLHRYCVLMQNCSPLSFSELAKEYLRRRKPGKWLTLMLFLSIAR